MTPEKYTRVLQDTLRLTDDQWRYTLHDLPKPADADRAGLMKSCSLTGNSTKQNIVLSFTQIPSNRATAAKPLSDFVHFTCADFRLQLEGGKAASFRESVDYVVRLLKSGLFLNGSRYSFYGHSNSQLKNQSCFLMAGSQEEVDREVEALGDFTNMKTVAKKAKRIGLLFATAHVVLNVDPDRCRDIPDVERDAYVFTDGCGNISPAMAKLLSQKRPILFRNKRYHPSVFQIRYRGYKGVVVREPRLDPRIWLEFRKSMRKFSGGHDHSFAVVEYSKPYTYGYLNDEIVLLMHSLGVEKTVIEQKQKEYFDFLDRAGEDPVFAFRFLSSIGSSELAEKLLLEGLEVTVKQLHKLLDQERGKMLKRGSPRCHILIPKSRLLFGVCDTYGVLREGECFVKPTMDGDGLPHALNGSCVLVARNPCLHPGDLQKLRVVDKPELAHLVDCIVFSVRGRRPAADMMSGGDLDGDTFFVCWDKDLIPAQAAQAAEYPGSKEPVRFGKITSSDRIEYFARSSSMQLGQIKNLFLKWARLYGPLCSQCQELNRLFSQCVDANRITIPDRLKDVPEPPQPAEFILDVLHKSASERMQAYNRPRVVASTDSVHDLLGLLAEPSHHSQFELAQMTLRWCQIHRAQFEDFWHLFDPAQLSSDERTWFICQLPPRKDIPEAVNNDLLQSDILSPQELSALGLRGARIRWRITYASASDRLANLLEVLYRTFPFITRKLLVLRIHDRLSIAMYLPMKVNPEDEVVLGSRSRVFAFPHGKDAFTSSRVVVPTKHNSRFYYDHQGFQLYEGKRANTFVFLARAANDDSKYRNVRGKGNRARAREETLQEGLNHEWRTSIALNKFSQGLATHVGRLWREGVSAAELYVISNTDTRSFRNLDLWLEQVDTDQVHLNFDQEEGKIMDAPALADLHWSKETDVVVAILKERKFEVLANASVTDVARVLELAWQTDSRDTISELFPACIQQLISSDNSARRGEVVSRLIGFLDFLPSMVIHFVRLSPWACLGESLRCQLLDRAPSLLKALVLCANRMGQLVVSHLRTILSELREISIPDLKEIIEFVALTVSSPETAMDVLTESLEPQTSRLLVLTSKNSQFLINRLSAIAIHHIEEAASSAKESKVSPYKWRFDKPLWTDSGEVFLSCDYRIDAPVTTRMATGDHVRFFCAEYPSNIVAYGPVYFAALVEKVEVGQITFKCLQHPPAFYQRSVWRLDRCGSFVTAQTMMDAVVKLVVKKEACCEVFPCLMASQSQPQSTEAMEHAEPTSDLSKLNPSQRSAVAESLRSPVCCIWGPPGTGKTQTVVAIILEILGSDREKRLLVTAPTHNAVDNVLRRFLGEHSENGMACGAIRVSTDIQKVSPDLRGYTCDAMLNKDINQNFSARRKAEKRISQSRLVFTTCIGAGLGLLRDEHFDNVIIDEASQQTEPASLVPMVKGCSRVILVGDHVQLRATVQPNAAALGFDVSLFESLWIRDKEGKGVKKVMLDTQYRMHPRVCAFPANEFYDSKLKSAPQCAEIPIPRSAFAWPKDGCRSVFVQVSATEDLGRMSKSNSGQGRVCVKILHQLRSPPQDAAGSAQPSYSIAILTPYTRQVELLKHELPGETVSSIDGFQGQESDVILYVSVRCNAHGEIGFLKDLRRLNVALTRARAGIIIVGDEWTLTGKSRTRQQREEGGEDSHLTWSKLIAECRRVVIDA